MSPFIHSMTLSLRNRARRLLRGREGARIFDSFDEALQACEGFEHEMYLDVIDQKTRIYLQQLNTGELSIWETVSNNLCVLQAATHEHELRVVDVGGACGIHYFQFRRFAQAVSVPLKELRWCVIETEEMISRAQSLANSELFFMSSLEDVPWRPHLIFTSSTLQYFPDPIAQIETFVDIRPDMIYFARTSFSNLDYNLLTIQTTNLSDNGIGELPPGFAEQKISWPHTTLSKPLFDRVMMNGYHLVVTFADSSWSCRVHSVRPLAAGTCIRGIRRPRLSFLRLQAIATAQLA